MITSPKPLRGHRRPNRGGADVDYQRQPYSLQNERHGERQLDRRETLACAHSHAVGRVDDRGRAGLQPAIVFSKIGSRP